MFMIVVIRSFSVSYILSSKWFHGRTKSALVRPSAAVDLYIALDCFTLTNIVSSVKAVRSAKPFCNLNNL